MIDHELTLRIKRWLEAEEHTELTDILDGATMMLQLNRNQALYNTILRRPQRYVEKIKYELNKFLPMRLARMTMDDVKTMEVEVLAPVRVAVEAEAESDEEAETLPLRNGKRPDHDDLPVLVKSIWEQNAERWKKIKETYNTCLSLEKPCDRYEHVVILKELWYKYKSEFDRYDSFILEPEGNEEKGVADPVQLAKDISNAQKYISKNAGKLIELQKKSLADGATEKQILAYNDFRKKMYDKLLVLVENNTELSDSLKAKLAEGGVTIETGCADNAESEESDTDAAETAE